MKENNLLTFLLPINEFNYNVLNHLKIFLESYSPQSDKSELLVVSTSTIISELQKLGILPEITQYVENNETDVNSYQKQINLAVSKVKTRYFVPVEFDDELHLRYVEIGKRYIESNEEVSVWVPIHINVFNNNGTIERSQLFNDPIWNRTLTQENEIGKFSNEILQSFSAVNLSGCIIKTDDFIELGGFKTKFELTFMYEYLLRATHNNKIVEALPKTMYVHFVKRQGSYHENLLATLTQEEIGNLYAFAKKEFYFTEDRDYK